MNLINIRICTWCTFAALLLTLTACNNGFDGVSQASAQPGIDPSVKRHNFVPGESFNYFYEVTTATYATIQADSGTTPRVTDLKSIADMAVRVTVTIFTDSSSGKLMKKIELRDLRVRAVTPADIQNGIATVAFQPIQTRLPTFPDPFSFSYEVGKDGDTALTFNTIFKGYTDPAFNEFVDFLTFQLSGSATQISDLIGSVRVIPGVDVQFLGTTYHSADQISMYNRVDMIDGIPQAYFKEQTAGNYYAAYGVESNVLKTYHLPLLGAAVGLVSRGDLQEQLFMSGTAILRQVTLTMQTPNVVSAIF